MFRKDDRGLRMVIAAAALVAVARIGCMVYFVVKMLGAVKGFIGQDVVTGEMWYDLLYPAFWFLILGFCQLRIDVK